MRTPRLLPMAVAALLVLAACTDVTGDLGDIPTTLPDASEVGDAADQVRNELEQLATEIENSEAADELQTQWTELQAEIAAAIASASSDGSFDTTRFEEAMDDFQSQLEAAGDDLSDEALAAWAAFRVQLEQLLS